MHAMLAAIQIAVIVACPLLCRLPQIDAGPTGQSSPCCPSEAAAPDHPSEGEKDDDGGCTDDACPCFCSADATLRSEIDFPAWSILTIVADVTTNEIASLSGQSAVPMAHTARFITPLPFVPLPLLI